MSVIILLLQNNDALFRNLDSLRHPKTVNCASYLFLTNCLKKFHD